MRLNPRMRATKKKHSQRGVTHGGGLGTEFSGRAEEKSCIEHEKKKKKNEGGLLVLVGVRNLIGGPVFEGHEGGIFDGVGRLSVRPFRKRSGGGGVLEKIGGGVVG